jgi:hypothetical protein
MLNGVSIISARKKRAATLYRKCYPDIRLLLVGNAVCSVLTTGRLPDDRAE